ncbi:MAG TPA: DsrE family protein [Rhizomicrobium sp.]|jgi:intracellular sulfur oxidation DsrE/DsrF family protein
MRKILLGAAIAFAALVSVSPIASAQNLDLTGIKLPTAEENAKMPVPEVATPAPHIGIAVDVPGAKELPDPKLMYKVVFDLAPAAKTPSEINPGLLTVGRFVNTLAKYGVPQEHRKFVVVFHRGSTPAILTNEEYKKRNNGVDNPNIKIMEQLHKAGVDFRVCGQSVTFNHIDPKTIQPIVELDLWAGITILNLTARGYVHLGGEG